MTATMARAMTVSKTELIACSCGQILGHRTRNALTLFGAELRLDGRGRPVIVCPVCGLFTVVKRTVKDGE